MTDDKGSVTVMTLMFFSVSKRGSHGSLHAGAPRTTTTLLLYWG